MKSINIRTVLFSLSLTVGAFPGTYGMASESIAEQLNDEGENIPNKKARTSFSKFKQNLKILRSKTWEELQKPRQSKTPNQQTAIETSSDKNSLAIVLWHQDDNQSNVEEALFLEEPIDTTSQTYTLDMDQFYEKNSVPTVLRKDYQVDFSKFSKSEKKYNLNGLKQEISERDNIINQLTKEGKQLIQDGQECIHTLGVNQGILEKQLDQLQIERKQGWRTMNQMKETQQKILAEKEEILAMQRKKTSQLNEENEQNKIEIIKILQSLGLKEDLKDYNMKALIHLLQINISERKKDYN